MLSKSKLLLLSTISLTLTACGGTNNASSDTGSDHPVFSWAKVAVTNGFGPSGDIIETQPDFTWPAVTGATEYNFGHETI